MNKFKINFEEIKNNGTIIYFGKYPKTLIVDNYLINALNKINEVNELGYIELDGCEYKKINSCSLYNSFSGYVDLNNELLEMNSLYFRVEPIKWYILWEQLGEFNLEKDDTTKFELQLISADAIDFQKYNDKLCSYKDSFIRKWLNKEFFDVAFNKTQQMKIKGTNLEGGLIDNVFLLSKEEVEKYYTPETTLTTANDYSICNGGFNNSNNNCPWMLRSSDETKFTMIWPRGNWIHTSESFTRTNGVVPVITLKAGVIDVKELLGE